MTDTPTDAINPEGWITKEDVADFGTEGESTFLFAKFKKWNIPLILQSDCAQSLAARDAEIEGLRSILMSVRMDRLRVMAERNAQRQRAEQAEAQATQLLSACKLAARYLDPRQFPDAVQAINEAMARAERTGGGPNG
jgi:hypothetical protein